MRAIYILWLRQLKRYFRSRSRIIGSLGQPLLFLVALGFGFGPIFQKAGAGDYMSFLAPGVIAMSVLFTATFFGIELIWDRQFGFLKETLVAPVSRLSIMVGRTLGGATVSVLQGIIVLLLTLLVGFRPHSLLALPAMLLFLVFISLIFTALGTAIASFLEDMHGFQLIMNFLIMPIFFLSGALFPLSAAPRALSIIAQFNPLTYGVDGLRLSLTGIGQFSLAHDIVILSAVTLAIFAIGSYLFNKIQA